MGDAYKPTYGGYFKTFTLSFHELDVHEVSLNISYTS